MRILPILVGVFLLGGPAALAAEAVPATAYFPVLPLNAPEESVPQLVPLAANQQLDGVHRGVTRAIVIIHDETRDANAAMSTLSALAGEMNATTMILAPQYLLPSDIVRFSDHLPDKGHDFAAWQVSGWSSGDDSMPISGRKSISSFTVVDLLLMYLSDNTIFPDLRTIVIAGFGAGADFTQRYAGFNFAADTLAKQNIDLRYVSAGAGSYFYQTPARFLGGRKGFGVPDAAACPGYNAYPYGLEKLNAYARRGGANAAKIDYATRFITYLNAKGPDAVPETNCAAQAQGKTSAERADNYRIYLQSLYGDVASRTQTFASAKEDKNAAVTLFSSNCGMISLFGDGLCPPSLGRIQ